MKRTNSGCKGAAKLNLYQCTMLVANGMISRTGKDYQAEEVEARIIELQSKKDERAIAALIRAQASLPDDTSPPPIPYDSYLTPDEIEAYGHLNVETLRKYSRNHAGLFLDRH